MSVTQLAITSPALFGRVRAIFVGYNDAVLNGKKEELAEELDVDSGEIDDAHNGFECVQCAAELET